MPGSFEELNAKINRLKREGGVGWVETKRLLNDGTKEPLDIFGDGSLFVHLTNEVIDLFGAVLTIAGGKNTVQVPVISDWYESIDGQQVVFTDSEKEHIVALCISNPEDGLEVGLYVRHTENSKVIEVSYKTIHPISDKYLPEGFGGGGLPVVELDVFPYFVAMGTHQFTAEDCAALDAAAKKGMPIIIKCSVNSDTIAYLCHFGIENGSYSFTIIMGGANFLITGKGDTWTATMQ